MTPAGSHPSRRTPPLRRLALLLALAAVPFAASSCRGGEPGLTALSADEFAEGFAADRMRAAALDRELESMTAFLEKRPGLSAPEVLSAADERALLDAWRAVWDGAFALDQIRAYYEDWWRFNLAGKERPRHVQSFLLTYAAELSLYEKSSRLVLLLDRNPNAVKFLEAPHPADGLPAGTLTKFRSEFQGNRDLVRVGAGDAYLHTVLKIAKADAEAARLGCAELPGRIDRHLEAIRALPNVKVALATAGSDLGALKRGVRRAWLPCQSAVADWMGDAKVRRHGVYLVSDEQLAELRPRLRAGDVLLARKNWYLSNVALPGFWPHAILYLGAPDELDKELDCPEARARAKKICGEELSPLACLERKFPEAVKAWRAGRGGRELLTMEAVSEGVQLSTLHEVGGDYLVALRPKLDRADRAEALFAAFTHLAKPYDFDFDFATDHAIVCTELVWRSYRPAEGKKGLEIPLVDVMGRRTLPANEVARLYAAQRGRPEAQFEFVAFYDGRERDKCAVPAGEEDFAKSCERAKWDVLLK
ncbi:MAG TPA: YiiX/YebB-like N1pC/P60 family cysteine hydrolase [Planctomycetota bacterium]|nr:YiiX/YebB-like N1pC/P60 family cysteine hydrolase [Planctomycetota bacterium]